jgi:hypothetical protein
MLHYLVLFLGLWSRWRCRWFTRLAIGAEIEDRAIAELDSVWMSHETVITRHAPATIVPELEILDR